MATDPYDQEEPQEEPQYAVIETKEDRVIVSMTWKQFMAWRMLVTK